MSDVWPALIGGAAGLATGVLGSIVAPWSQWGVEKRRIVLEDRKAAVEAWRAGLAHWEAETRRLVGNGVMPPLFSDQAWYSSLRPHLTDTEREFVENKEVSERSAKNTGLLSAVNRHLGDYRPPAARRLQKEIERIAKDWNVV